MFVALAPVVRMHNAHDSFLGSISYKQGHFRTISYQLGINEIFGKGWSDNSAKICTAMPYLCHAGSYLFVSDSIYIELER